LYKKIITTVSATMFILMAVVVSVVTEIHEMSMPTKLGATWAVSLDFEKSGLTDQEAFNELSVLDRRMGLGLYLVTADVEGKSDRDLFVSVAEHQPPIRAFQRYGDVADGKVIGRDYLAHSFATGRYVLVNGAQQPALADWLTDHNVKAEWIADDAGVTIRSFVQGGFTPSFFAALTLLIAMALFWLSVRSRGRALRVLAGVPTWRISSQDLAALGGAISMSGVAVTAVASAVVYLHEGSAFVPYYAKNLFLLVLMLTVLCLTAAAVLGLRAWPSAAMLARRKPAAGAFSGVSLAVRAMIFALVAASVAPAVMSYQTAADTAKNLAMWNSLADQAALREFGGSGDGEAEFARTAHGIGQLVRAAETTGAVSLSLAWSAAPDPDVPGPTVDYGKYQDLVIVSRSWLKLIQRPETPAAGLHRMEATNVPPAALKFIDETWKLWARDPKITLGTTPGTEFYDFSSSQPLAITATGGHDLKFLSRALVVVIDKVYPAINDDNLGSLCSTGNVSFTGLDSTERLTHTYRINSNWRVVRAAADGILAARFAAYFAWIQAISTLGLLIALLVTTGVGAFISSVVNARHDFPLRLFGSSWTAIIGNRIIKESAILGGLSLAIAALQPGSIWLILLTFCLALSMVIGCHLLTARWNFRQIAHRNI
jgi:hypothetical protein